MAFFLLSILGNKNKARFWQSERWGGEDREKRRWRGRGWVREGLGMEGCIQVDACAIFTTTHTFCFDNRAVEAESNRMREWEWKTGKRLTVVFLSLPMSSSIKEHVSNGNARSQWEGEYGCQEELKESKISLGKKKNEVNKGKECLWHFVLAVEEMKEESKKKRGHGVSKQSVRMSNWGVEGLVSGGLLRLSYWTEAWWNMCIQRSTDTNPIWSPSLCLPSHPLSSVYCLPSKMMFCFCSIISSFYCIFPHFFSPLLCTIYLSPSSFFSSPLLVSLMALLCLWSQSISSSWWGSWSPYILPNLCPSFMHRLVSHTHASYTHKTVQI